MGAPPPLIDTTDWAGRAVVLLQSDWSHICQKHDDLLKKFNDEQTVLDAIEQTVKQPDRVFLDPARSYVESAYRELRPRQLLRVIIWYIGSGPGEIKTSHFIPRPSPKEVQRWP